MIYGAHFCIFGDVWDFFSRRKLKRPKVRSWRERINRMEPLVFKWPRVQAVVTRKKRKVKLDLKVLETQLKPPTSGVLRL